MLHIITRNGEHFALETDRYDVMCVENGPRLHERTTKLASELRVGEVLFGSGLIRSIESRVGDTRVAAAKAAMASRAARSYLR